MYVLPSPVCFSLLAGVEHQSLWMKRPRLQVLCTYADGKGAPASWIPFLLRCTSTTVVECLLLLFHCSTITK
ncbi:hypothetical protein BRADI_2g27752v3 [Brachypodium distachyon]|uniref:Uncharacterized protein n=1 Tax=Brachypodium distachyon TaxID=15368 RepID=A0A2K2DB06_BRADI|nr:hypothetical protein BRADI_2g27752v3 [Brachypodium distachyon]